jgi:hypothetical protein
MGLPPVGRISVSAFSRSIVAVVGAFVYAEVLGGDTGLAQAADARSSIPAFR